MTSDISSNNKRIAKNTLFLYFRTILVMLVSLYTSRVVLTALGVEDFGLYSVVGGIVVMLGILNSAMASATQRFLNYEMGRSSEDRIHKVFSSSFLIHLMIAFVIFLIAETLGLWFLNTHMNIVSERMVAANWVYQFSILSFMVTVINVPYNAAIIAHEHMSTFAYVSIIEAVMKLLIAFVLYYAPFDRLVWYALLMLLEGIVLRVIYGIYCSRHFGECNFRRKSVDYMLVRRMLSFSSWTIFGNLGRILHTQGISVLINMFFGVAVNAAQGIANQVNGAVQSFLSNFLTALNPQIVKNYAAGDIPTMRRLISRGCRLAFFLVLLMLLPIALETPLILRAWLKTVPAYTVIFVRLILLLTLLDSFSGVLATAQGATGKIKTYQIVLTVIGFFHLPLSWIFFLLGYEPYYAMYIYVFVIIILQILRIWFVCRSLQWAMSSFYASVVLRQICVAALSCLLPIFLHNYISASVWRVLSVVFVSIVSVGVCSLFVGLDSRERNSICKSVIRKLNVINSYKH